MCAEWRGPYDTKRQMYKVKEELRRCTVGVVGKSHHRSKLVECSYFHSWKGNSMKAYMLAFTVLTLPYSEKRSITNTQLMKVASIYMLLI